ncbi:MAG: chemotaxis protein CheA, partial [Candidatus Muiribacteriota bacterium]
MVEKLKQIKELLKKFSYGDGITYTEIKEILSSFEDSPEISALLDGALEELFFCGYSDFDKKLEKYDKDIDKIIKGKYNFDKEIKKAKKKIDDKDLVSDFISESKEGLNDFEMKLLEYEESGNVELINDIFRTVHTIKGSSGFLELEKLNSFAHIGENLLDDLRNKKLKITGAISEFLFEVLDIFKHNFELLSKSLPSGFYPDFEIDIEYVKRKVDIFQGGGNTEEEEITPVKNNKSKVKSEEEEVDDIEESNDKNEEIIEANTSEESKSAKTGAVAKSIKVDVEKVDTLLDDVGELIVVNNMLFQDKNILDILDKGTQNTLNQLKRISSRLQNSSMSLRMVPIGNTFQKMMRIVRDNSRRLKKLIKLEISGEATEIDRNMVEKLYDPLMHMIRNSCDHGVETPEEREAAGKNPTGTVWLSAYHKGGNIVIEIKDDGKGLSKEKILEKAYEKGILSPNESITDQEIYHLIFNPGFSTAAVVSEISGRGVGMDVVKNSISYLGGRIDIETEKDKGTTFYIKLPLTLAILDGVIIGIGKEKYIIPAQVVEEGIKPNKENCFNMANKGEVVKVRDKIFRLVRLYDYFRIEPQTKNPWEGIVLIVETERDKIGLLIDDILGKQEVVIKTLSNFFKDYDF